MGWVVIMGWVSSRRAYWSKGWSVASQEHSMLAIEVLVIEMINLIYGMKYVEYHILIHYLLIITFHMVREDIQY